MAVVVGYAVTDGCGSGLCFDCWTVVVGYAVTDGLWLWAML